MLNRNFILMCCSNFLLIMAVVAQFPLLRYYAEQNDYCNIYDMKILVPIFGLGMFLLGPLNAYLVDRYSRKDVFRNSVVGLIATTILMLFINTRLLMAILILLQGMFFGMIQMVLGGTLINDLTISEQRNNADYCYRWVGRIAIIMGLALSELMVGYLNNLEYEYYVLISLMFLGMMCVMFVYVPFRACDKVSLFSFDRFLGLKSWKLMLMLLLSCIVVGYFLTGFFELEKLLLFFVGVILALIIHSFYYISKKEIKIIYCFAMLVLSLVIMIFSKPETLLNDLSFIMLALTIGLYNASIQLKFMKLSKHCERATYQQTYILVVFSGMCIGYIVGLL